MRFIWPDQLWLAMLLPLLVLLYTWLLRRRKKSVLRMSSLALVKQALGPRPGWRRHVPPALLLAAIASLVVAGARPAAIVTL
ncbi:MAG TPA: BatA domain-containing protein, partial [Burkholderiaceae bacterium]|nr:BatA domain-containing protein [Burkholderiaceae bacterium]